MAMAQARAVAGLLSSVIPGLEVAISGITTTADRWDGDLAVLGGKGLFVKEIDRALLTSAVDIAVHCVKDVPGDVPLPPGLVFAAYLPREDVRDCLVFPLGTHGRGGLRCCRPARVLVLAAAARHRRKDRHQNEANYDSVAHSHGC